MAGPSHRSFTPRIRDCIRETESFNRRTFCCRHVVHAFCARFRFPFPSSATIVPLRLFDFPFVVPVCESSLFEWAVDGVVTNIVEDPRICSSFSNFDLNSGPNCLAGRPGEFMSSELFGNRYAVKPVSGQCVQPTSEFRPRLTVVLNVEMRSLLIRDRLQNPRQDPGS